MKKNDFEQLMYRVIDYRHDMRFEFTTSMYVHLYTDDDLFSATFICRVIDIARDYFIGVSVDCDGRPYLLFAD